MDEEVISYTRNVLSDRPLSFDQKYINRLRQANIPEDALIQVLSLFFKNAL